MSFNPSCPCAVASTPGKAIRERFCLVEEAVGCAGQKYCQMSSYPFPSPDDDDDDDDDDEDDDDDD